MTILGDFWNTLPREIKFIFALAVFLYAGASILQGVVIVWNLFGVNAINLVNGCFAGSPGNCVPAQEGIFIFGINFADYWTITLLLIFPVLIIFALKWYGMTINIKGSG